MAAGIRRASAGRQLTGVDEILGHRTQLDVVHLGVAAKHGEGLGRIELEALHHDALRLTDERASVDRGAQRVDLLLVEQRRTRVHREHMGEPQVVR